ncbi:MAG: hypothetical protein H7Z40_06725 [Phycisphaerae bacterium]|nr:hypothetical protein [Gemmatimonadaceae bacterium]
MLRTPLKLGAAVVLAFFVLWALMRLGPDFEARLESKSDTVQVLQHSGMWYHQYTVTALRVSDVATAGATASDSDESEGDEIALPVAATSVDTSTVERITIRTTEAQYDSLRIGARMRVHRLPLLSAFAWMVEESVLLGALKALRARTVRYENPRAVAPTLGRTAGLGRVVSVHRITPKRGALESTATGTALTPTSFEVIVVEFWARRHRTLVRTADVVDARSIDDLGPGQILQMHYDQFVPRSMRLDDGMRTNVP